MMHQSMVAFLLFASALGGSLTYESFRSPGIPLKSGQVAQTEMIWPIDKTGKPLDWVKGPVSMRYFKADIVDSNNKSIPLSEIYTHHWQVFDADDVMGKSTHPFNAGPCGGGVKNVWGIGAEYRYQPYEYPAPYGIVTTGKERWSVVLHLIRTTNVPDVQACIECTCPDSKPPQQPKGGVACCPDRSMCFGMENSTLEDTKTYYLAYTIGYEPIVEGVTIPLTVFTMDATATETYNCHIEYQIPALGPDETNVLQNSASVLSNLSLVSLHPHQHIGGLNYTVDHMRDGKLLGTICYVVPKYGTGRPDEVGNELGYLVGEPACRFDPPYNVSAGDEIRLTSIYGARTLPGGHPWHEGVMALLFMYGVSSASPEENCVKEMDWLCGKPPYHDLTSCPKCVKENYDDLIGHGCSLALLERQCRKTTGGGNIPVPDTVTGMMLNVQTRPHGDATVTMAGPVGAWFAVGFNPSAALMVNATAWVYSSSGNDAPRLQMRTLGDHYAGVVLQDPYPVESITTKDSTVAIVFNVTGVKTGSQNCILFAQGDTITGMELAYHGSARGTTCGLLN
eukprot:TRINITY_DN10165_c0_g1_i1.p1 TRINITY_DN10165_c0_g1~~TRINITY_DN10165_c0_g1_i1.p1  ORF type:complete len:580 (+),score=142.78 TRINITY_DN10165_c0_g1_i1:48-1742(+)